MHREADHNLGKKVSHALKWSAFGKLTGQAISWAITLVVIRLLEPSDYGLVAMAMVVVGFVSMFAELGLQPAIIQLEDVDHDLLRKLFGLLLTSYLFLAALISLSAHFVADFYSEPRVVSIIYVLALSFFLNAFTTIPFAMLSREMRFKSQSLVNLASMLTISLVTLLFALNGFGVWSIVYGNISGVVVQLVAINAVRFSIYIPSFDWRGLRGVLNFGGFILLQRTLWWVSQSFDRILIGRYQGTETLGSYSVGFDLASMPRDKLNAIINQVTISSVPKVRHDRRLLRDHLSKGLYYTAAITIPIFFGISAVGLEIVTVVLGDKWRDAIIPITLIPPALAIRLLGSIVLEAANGCGRADKVFSALLTNTVVTVSSIAVGLNWGISGVCVALILSSVANVGANVHSVRKITAIDLGLFLGAIARPVALGATMYLCVYAARNLLSRYFPEALFPAFGFAGAFLLVYLVLTGVAVYLVGLLVFDRRRAVELFRFLRQ